MHLKDHSLVKFYNFLKTGTHMELAFSSGLIYGSYLPITYSLVSLPMTLSPFSCSVPLLFFFLIDNDMNSRKLKCTCNHTVPTPKKPACKVLINCNLALK